jgi:flagellar motor protein MotB
MAMRAAHSSCQAHERGVLTVYRRIMTNYAAPFVVLIAPAAGLAQLYSDIASAHGRVTCSYRAARHTAWRRLA